MCATGIPSVWHALAMTAAVRYMGIFHDQLIQLSTNNRPQFADALRALLGWSVRPVLAPCPTYRPVNGSVKGSVPICGGGHMAGLGKQDIGAESGR